MFVCPNVLTEDIKRAARPEQDEIEDEEEQKDPGKEAEYFSGFDPTLQMGCRL